MPIKLPDRELGSRGNPLDISNKKSVYNYDYYSGANIGVYIGDVLVDEITSIRYNIEQSKRPVYGYSSYNWDFMAKGTTIVHGSFSINFKESGYLYYVLEYIKKQNNPAPYNIQDKKMLRRNIERLIPPAGGKPPASAYELYQDLAALDDAAFEDIAESFEDSIWGGDPRVQEAGQRSYGRPDYQPEFDIYLAYGDINDQQANHTARRITGVELTGNTQLIEISGEPLQEGYSFLARDVVMGQGAL